ncbi:MAG: aKG-HExxH-type peptide beta-hydroxylase [Sulfobacillus sp.]
MSMHPKDINWAWMGEPQSDEYDTAIALWLACEEKNWRRPGTMSPPNFCDGRVGLRPWPLAKTTSPNLAPELLDHPNLFRAEDYLRSLWPVVYRQFTRLVSVVHPMVVLDRQTAQGIGSSSGNLSGYPFTMYVTCYDPFGTAESMVHEMAHIKLRCFGVDVESCSRLIRNPQDERFVSPLRSFKRPMTAVVHAFYSWLYLTELGVRLADFEPKRATARLARNCDWIEQMANEIRRNLRTDEAGEDFFEPLFAWSGSLLKQGRALISGTSPHERKT